MAEGEVRIKELEEVTTLTQNHYFVVDDSSSGGKSKKYLADKVTAPLDNALLNEASSYDTTHTYNEGDYCLKDNVLYRCLYDNVTGTWTASKWVQTSLGADLTENTNDTQQAFVEGTASGTIATFTDGSNLPLKSLTADITALQDLHGYENPWVGGSGKNKLNNIASSKTENNVTFTVNSDGSVKVYSTGATATTVLVLTDTNNPLIIQANKSYILSGCPNGGSYSTYELMLIATPTSGSALVHDYGSGVTIESSESDRILGVQIVIRSGQVINDTFYPMVRLASVSDATFEPYSNICPISGWDEVNVGVVGANLIDITSMTPTYALNGITYTINSDGSVTANGTATARSQVYWSIPQNTAKTLANKKLSGGSSQSGCSLFLELNESPFTNYATDTGEGATISSDIANATTTVNYVFRIAQGTTVNNLTITPRITDEMKTYTIDLDGTRYGGTLDVVSGVLTVDRVLKTLVGTETWTYTSTYNRVYTYISDAKKPSGAIVYSILSDKLHFSSGVKEDYGAHINNAGNLIVFAPSSITSDDQWKTWLASNNVQVVYELATPQTIQLTPTEVKSLLATNNVFADTGDILDATYVRNANITINDLIRRIEALEG